MHFSRKLGSVSERLHHWTFGCSEDISSYRPQAGFVASICIIWVRRVLVGATKCSANLFRLKLPLGYFDLSDGTVILGFLSSRSRFRWPCWGNSWLPGLVWFWGIWIEGWEIDDLGCFGILRCVADDYFLASFYVSVEVSAGHLSPTFAAHFKEICLRTLCIDSAI